MPNAAVGYAGDWASDDLRAYDVETGAWVRWQQSSSL